MALPCSVVYVKAMVGVSFRWEPEFLERVRVVAGERGLSRFVRGAVESALMAGDLERERGLSLSEMAPRRTESVRLVPDLTALEQVIARAPAPVRSASQVPAPAAPQRAADHLFKRNGESFRCEICGVTQGSHG